MAKVDTKNVLENFKKLLMKTQVVLDKKLREKTEKQPLKKKLSKTFSSKKNLIYSCSTTITILGAKNVGKTEMIKNLTQNLAHPEKRKLPYRPSLTETYEKKISLRSKEGIVCRHDLELIDTSGQLQIKYPYIYREAIKRGEAFVVIFKINDQSTLVEAKQIIKDIENLKRNSNTPILLLGMEAVKGTSREFHRNMRNSISANNINNIVNFLGEIEKRKGIFRLSDELEVIQDQP